MSAIQLPDASQWSGAVRVTDLGLILAEGADAATFLHGQFSQDVKNQSTGEARLAAYCSAKGRMLASLVTLHPAPERYWLLTDRAVLPGLQKRLSMFVMRSKVVLSDATESLAVLGIVGSAVADSVPGAAEAAPWQALVQEDGSVFVRQPDVQGVRRGLLVGATATVAAVQARLSALDEAVWRWLEVMSGIARIEGGTVDQFVPQMLNYELIGGVNFKKGCYPGQEVVARSQYRGTTKRRAFVLHAPEQVQSGQEVFSEVDPGQPAGLIVNATPVPGSSAFSALVELKLTAVDSALHAGTVAGPALLMAAQPYPLPSADEAA
jgi:folate-binding protein YgfZ